MPNLRKLAEKHLAITLEGDFGLPVNLIDPDGIRYNDLSGQVLYDIRRMNPETGEEVTVSTPVVSLRRSTMSRIPAAGEKWIVEIPTIPDPEAEKKQYIISPTRAPEGGASIGFIRIYLQEVEQI